MAPAAVIAAIVGSQFFATPFAQAVVPAVISGLFSIVEKGIVNETPATRADPASALSALCPTPVYEQAGKFIKPSYRLSNDGRREPRRGRNGRWINHRRADGRRSLS
jgi:hypothetical protein